MANQKIVGMGFHHLALRANDYEKTLDFYKELGMTPVVSWGKGDDRITMMDIGDGGRLEIFANGSDKYPAEGKYQHFAYVVQDVEKAYDMALKAGAKSVTPPQIANIKDAQPGPLNIQIAFVEGPNGEIIEFFKQLLVL